jgi:hypothetical protein
MQPSKDDIISSSTDLAFCLNFTYYCQVMGEHKTNDLCAP